MPLLEQVLEKNPDNVKIVYKSFPLRKHKFAMKAAIAVLAAESQDKFWEFHDLLFEDFNELNDEKVLEIAGKLGLNKGEFEKKMKDPELGMKIRKDLADGSDAGVRGTPTIFINGRLLKNRSLMGFQKVIDKELSKIQEKAAQGLDER